MIPKWQKASHSIHARLRYRLGFHLQGPKLSSWSTLETRVTKTQPTAKIELRQDSSGSWLQPVNHHHQLNVHCHWRLPDLTSDQWLFLLLKPHLLPRSPTLTSHLLQKRMFIWSCTFHSTAARHPADEKECFQLHFELHPFLTRPMFLQPR